MIKIRGNRLYYTPSNDAELPEGERRAFIFSNPSVSSFDDLVAKHAGKQGGERSSFQTVPFIHDLLRGWSNIRTDDAAVAAKYGVSVPDGQICMNVDLPFPTKSPVAANLSNLITLPEWEELVKELLGVINPAPSGN